MDAKKTIFNLVSLPVEAEWLEFKTNGISPEKLGEYISALSNAACDQNKRFGYLVFGVEDKTHNLVGTTFRFDQSKIGNEDLEAWLSRLLDPRIDFRVTEIDIDSKHFVLFTIDAASTRPVSFKNTEFIRIGSYNKKLRDHPEKERKIWQNQNNHVFGLGIALSDCSPDQVLRLLDYPAYFYLLDLALPSNKQGIIIKLIEEKFISENQDGTYDILNLGAILFAKDLSSFDNLKRKSLRIILYKENNRLEAIKEWSSPKGYAISYSEVVNYIIDQLPQNEVIERAVRRKVKMYPDLAIRELVANALIHQDFQMRGGSMVEIFQDRIEITNPGKPLINTLRFIDHSPASRNEYLASFFRRVEFCEERGSGIDKVISAIEHHQLPAPKFFEGDNYLRVLIYSHKPYKEMGRDDRLRACYQHCCLKYINNEIATNRSLRERLEISEKNYSVVSRLIADAINQKLIQPSNIENRSRKHASYVPFWA